jgi:GNAT superfamily N-acetyltransferase
VERALLGYAGVSAGPVAPPFDGSPSWRATHKLRDGAEVTIRAIQPADRDELWRAFQRTSPRTRYLRFLGVIGELTEPMLTYLTCVDQTNHVALVATMSSNDLKTEQGVGVGRFIRIDGEPAVAEGAITVADDFQRRGIGTAIAHELERAARARGIRTMRAEVLESNAEMRSILEGAGAKPRGASDGTIAYDIDLEETEPPSHRFMDVLRGAATTMAMSIRRLVPPESRASDADAPAPKRE